MLDGPARVQLSGHMCSATLLASGTEHAPDRRQQARAQRALLRQASSSAPRYAPGTQRARRLPTSSPAPRYAPRTQRPRPRDAENAPQHFRRDRDSPPGGEYALVDLCGQTFGKEVQAWFGEGERTMPKDSSPLVPLHWLGFGYAALVASGGIIGYAKAGSVPSLAAGLLFGGLAGLGSYQLSQDPKNVWLFLVTSGTLAGIMGMRFYNSRKFMPAGLIAGASLLMVVKLGISALSKPHQ
ncbi:hypothetical protein E5288_WYG019857 [Bos mutus]|uniref:Transmembrane protein 14C n=3 Tax=Bos TaxID=9903 RepID=A0A6B0RPA4_9CETA|nr:hypothetical protein [Bos mutus]